ncbi:hypothetical protein BVRB_8g200750 [Beta vulgaris subsp. vulgaris]|uniref:Uncharacterized protein n=1 Tax=Beta vulgaris subsp. vulgaris TaxID=3555 RepID=A0A0J8B9L2_BETVV|nr:SEC12-like protein 1 [Beta vulgaris subsp. vulgaris]KMS96688.1 hypothetical protein BVRB_8g200750 [Beta vulgaris subsp. vulgaris]
MELQNVGIARCGKWIKRPENVNFVILGKSYKSSSAKSKLEIFSFDPKTTTLESSPLTEQEIEDGEPVSIAVHPNGDQIICATSSGDCKIFELCVQETSTKLLAKEAPSLEGVGLQNCVAFSIDGCKLGMGGEDGRLRILEWPSMRIIIDEPAAHKSFRDMDFSLDSEFLVSTSTDGSARVWNVNEGVPVATLKRSANEKIELCCFSKDGTKPFVFCTVQRAKLKPITAVWDMSTWKRIGYKVLLGKPASVMSTSPDGKYLAQGSKDGDFCVVDVNNMRISHWSKRLHPGTSIGGVLEFCPSERVVLTTTEEWGTKVTKLTVPADWKDWQIYTLLLILLLASAVAFYIFYVYSDSFWQVPGTTQHSRPKFDTLIGDPQSEDPFGPLDL